MDDSPGGAPQKSRMPRAVLFVHNNFPGQFRDLAQQLVARGTPCAAIGGEQAPGLSGVRIERSRNVQGTGAGVFRLAVRAEADLIRGYGAYEAAQRVKASGFSPDL